MLMTDSVDVELTCCGFPVEVNHREGDRVVHCPMCNIDLVVEAIPQTTIHYQVREMSAGTAQITKAIRQGGQQ